MFSLTGVSPPEGSKRNPLDTLIEFTIVDDESGINSSTLIVQINGTTAVEGSEFKPGFAGIYSDINPVGNNLSVVINTENSFEENSVINVKIQVQNFLGKYNNFNYSFKVIENKPYLFFSSPENNSNVVSPQRIFLEFKDDSEDLDLSTINISINGAYAIKNGDFQNGFNGIGSNINSVTLRNVEITIDPDEFLRDGAYTLRYEISNSNSQILSSSFKFFIKYTEVPLPDIFPQGGFVGFFQGVTSVRDLGNGKDLYVSWSKPASRFYNSDIYVLLYYSEDRLKIFDSEPKYLIDSSILETTLSEFAVGIGYYFAARVMETYKDSLNTDGMGELSPGIFYLPSSTTLVEEISDESTIIRVSSVAGFPATGLLKIGSEVIRYNSINFDENEFLVPSGGRGLSGTTPAYHDSTEPVEMFLSCQDDNNVIIYGTCTYQDQESTGRQYNGIGLIVPDFSDFEKMAHDGLDHCGYHQPLPWEVLNNKNDCGTYLGGEYNGFRGVNIYQRALDREEELMENVGEKCVLLKRLWSGETCSCVTLRRQHPKIRSCKFCFGTGIVGGYEQYVNQRRADKRVLIRFYETAENLALGDHQHLNQEFKPTALALYKPIIKDRDVIIRFDYTDDIEFIYEVLDSSRERFVFNKYGRQKLNLMRMDKTDVLYQYPFVKNP
jgi:hypothetical protein